MVSSSATDGSERTRAAPGRVSSDAPTPGDQDNLHMDSNARGNPPDSPKLHPKMMHTPGNPKSDPKIFNAAALPPAAKLALYRKIVGITPNDTIRPWPFDAENQVVYQIKTRDGAEEKKNLFLLNTGYRTALFRAPALLRWMFWSNAARGCYHETLVKERIATWYYYLSVSFVYTALLSQIVFGATIATMSSANQDHSTVISVLSAFVSVLGAVLAWMKGLGIPHRTLQYRYALGRVRFYIELRESEFQCTPMAEELDPVEEAWQVVRMFRAVVKDYERNQPDVYDTEDEHRVRPLTAICSLKSARVIHAVSFLARSMTSKLMHYGVN